MKCPKCKETVVSNAFYCGVCQYKLQPKDKEDIYVDKIKKLEAEIVDGQYQVKIAKADAEKAKIMENGATQRYKISQQTQAEINQDIRRHQRIRLISWATVISIVAIVFLILFSSFIQENGNIAELEQRINEKEHEIVSLRNNQPQIYQIANNRVYLYYWVGYLWGEWIGTHNRDTNGRFLYNSEGNNLRIYAIRDNFGLTRYGWVRMQNLRQQ